MKKLFTKILCLAGSAVLLSTAIPVFSHAEEVEADNGEIYTVREVPAVYINTAEGNGLSLEKGDSYTIADIVIVDTDGTIIHQSGQVKVRGNSTAEVPKKPYTIKFDKKQDVLGMGKAKKWVLLASCLDPTFLRNRLALKVSQDMGLPYTSDISYAELWMDGVYRGCYEIAEPVDDGATRVDIDVESNNGMADFIIQFEYNRSDPSATYFTADDLRFEIKTPDITSEEQRLYVKYKILDIYNVIKTKNFEEIEKLIDVDSFAKYYLLNEIFKNVDFGFSSAFFFYKDGILYAGPPWDYDLTAGNLNYYESENSRLCLDTANLFDHQFHFYKYLLQCREFQNALRRVYAENFGHFENLYSEGGVIDSVTEQYYPVFQRNFDETEWDLNTQYKSLMRVPVGDYFDNVNYLRDWLRERNEWLSSYYDINGDLWFTVGDIDGNSEITIADAVRLEQYLLSKRELSDAEKKSADISCDDVVDVFDMVSLRQILIERNISAENS